MVTISDRNGNIVYANAATERVSGFAPEEFASLDPFGRMHPEDRPRCEGAFERLLGTPGLSLELEHRVRHKDGSWRWVEATFASLFDAPGVEGLLATVRDVTERKRAEKALRDSEERLAADLAGMRRLYELHSKLAVETDLHAALEEIVTAACEFTGTDRGCVQLVNDDGERLEMFAWRGYADDNPFVEHFRHEGSKVACDMAREHKARSVTEDIGTSPLFAGTRDREVALAENIRAAQSTPMVDRRGELIGVLGTQFRRPHRPSDDALRLVDMLAWSAAEFVERHRAQTALEESEARYRAFVTASSDVVYRMGPDWSEMRRLDGRGFISDTAEPTGEWMERYIHPEDRPLVRTAIEEAVRTKDVFELEHRVWRVDGTLGWTLSRAVPILGAGGEVLEWLGTASDVTARRKAEAALREGEERQAFLLNLSDALRPLADPAEIKALASRLLGEHLGVDRVMYGEIDPGGETITVGRSWSRAGAASLAGRFRIGDFGRFFSGPLREGRAVYAEDAMNDPHITPEEYAHSWVRIGVRSAIAYPIVKEERFVAALVVQVGRPRLWADAEMKLVSEVAERTWEAAQRARTEEALRASEEQYRMLFTSIDEGFCTIEVIFDERGEAVDYRFLEMNPAFERQTGLEDASGRTVRELAPEHEAFWFEIYGRIVRTGEARRFEHEAAALDPPRYYDVYAFRIDEPEENRVAVIFNDVLARKRAEEERERLRALEASARAEAAERARIGRELHDRVAHTMGIAHQSMELHSALAESAPERAREKLELARESTRIALDQTRALSSQLARRNTQETRDGLTAALRVLLETHVPDGVETELSAVGDESAVPPTVKEQAYLVMREAVRNAVAHSGCGRVGVSVGVEGGEFRGRVQDDGEGFDPPREEPDGGRDGGEGGRSPLGVGLRSMRERTEMLGGRLEVASDPGRGSSVEVRIPLED